MKKQKKDIKSKKYSRRALRCTINWKVIPVSIIALATLLFLAFFAKINSNVGNATNGTVLEITYNIALALIASIIIYFIIQYIPSAYKRNSSRKILQSEINVISSELKKIIQLLEFDNQFNKTDKNSMLISNNYDYFLICKKTAQNENKKYCCEGVYQEILISTKLINDKIESIYKSPVASQIPYTLIKYTEKLRTNLLFQFLMLGNNDNNMQSTPYQTTYYSDIFFLEKIKKIHNKISCYSDKYESFCIKTISKDEYDSKKTKDSLLFSCAIIKAKKYIDITKNTDYALRNKINKNNAYMFENLIIEYLKSIWYDKENKTEYINNAKRILNYLRPYLDTLKYFLLDKEINFLEIPAPIQKNNKINKIISSENTINKLRALILTNNTAEIEKILAECNKSLLQWYYAWPTVRILNQAVKSYPVLRKNH